MIVKLAQERTRSAFDGTAFWLGYPEKIFDDSVPKIYQVKNISEQTRILQEIFPKIGFADEELVTRVFQKQAEGWFAIPRWYKIAGTYNSAFIEVLRALIERLGHEDFYDLDDFVRGRWGPQCFRQHEDKVKAFKMLHERQQGEIFIVQAQFGLHHRKISTVHGRKIFLQNEVGLGAFEVGCMILTHLERFSNQEFDFPNIILGATCPGDEYAFSAPYWGNCNGKWKYAPFYYLCERINKLSISITGIDNDCAGHCGLVTMFL